MPGVGDTREAQAQAHGQVVLHGLPGSEVVSGPGLHVALHPRGTGARDEERTLVRTVGQLLLVRSTHHKECLQRPRQPDGQRFAKTEALRVIRGHLEFVVIVPGAVDAVIQQLLLGILFPPIHGCRVGKVQRGSSAAPELESLLILSIRGADEGFEVLHFVETHMGGQQGGFDVGRQANSVAVEAFHHLFGVRHAVAVPGKYIAFAILAQGIA